MILGALVLLGGFLTLSPGGYGPIVLLIGAVLLVNGILKNRAAGRRRRGYGGKPLG